MLTYPPRLFTSSACSTEDKRLVLYCDFPKAVRKTAGETILFSLCMYTYTTTAFIRSPPLSCNTGRRLVLPRAPPWLFLTPQQHPSSPLLYAYAQRREAHTLSLVKLRWWGGIASHEILQNKELDLQSPIWCLYPYLLRVSQPLIFLHLWLLQLQLHCSTIVINLPHSVSRFGRYLSCCAGWYQESAVTPVYFTCVRIYSCLEISQIFGAEEVDWCSSNKMASLNENGQRSGTWQDALSTNQVYLNLIGPKLLG